jgi:hypothetical protein
MTLCDRWHKLPEEILAMDTSNLQVIRVAALGGYFDKDKEVPEWQAAMS